jgi:tRNA(fMet)-specific endonuclease VapC
VRVVLDSNIAIAAMNRVQLVVDRLAGLRGSEVGIPIVAVAELAYGARRSSRAAQNLERIGSLRRSIATLPLTEAVADRYAVVRADLESRGQAKSDFDLLIACTAIEEEATLVTADAALLDGTIAGLRAENWLQA